MILIDSSAWIEFLRDTRSTTCELVTQILGTDVATCDPISMEILAGARDEQHLKNLRGLLASTTMVTTQPSDYEEAAAIYRTCRRQGATPRKLIDCLIAAIAIRAEVSLVHADTDFDAIARCTALRIVS